MERQRRLDQPGDAGGRLGVADHRLDRADRARSARAVAGSPNTVVSAVELGAVAGDGPGAVRLDQADRGGRVAGLGVGAPQRPHLALGPRRGEAPVAAVAGGADAADHGVDAVAVALGVGQALEHDGRRTPR